MQEEIYIRPNLCEKGQVSSCCITHISRRIATETVQHMRVHQTREDNDGDDGGPCLSRGANGVDTMRPMDHQGPVGSHGRHNPDGTGNSCVVNIGIDLAESIMATYEVEASGEPNPQSKRSRDDDTEICNRQRQKITVHGGPAGPEAADDEDSHGVANRRQARKKT